MCRWPRPSSRWIQNEFVFLKSHLHISVFPLNSAEDIEQYLNAILRRSNRHCENDKYVFLLQGRFIIIVCTRSCSVCSQRLLLSLAPFLWFLLFFLQVSTKFSVLVEVRGGARASGRFRDVPLWMDGWREGGGLKPNVSII